MKTSWTNKSKLVVDSWALGRVSTRSKTGRNVDERISDKNELWTSVVCLAEVVSKYRRKDMDETVAIEAISSLSKFGIPDLDDVIEAGEVHGNVKEKSPNFGLADSFALQLARKIGAKVLTDDPDFKGLGEFEYVGSV